MPHLELAPPAVHGRHLVVPYVIVNRGAAAIFTRSLIEDVYGLCGDLRLNGLVNPHPLPTPESAFVMSGGDGALVLVQGHDVLPAGASDATPPCALRVAPGGRVRAAVRCPLPLREWHPDLCPSDDKTRPVEVARVNLLVEYVAEADVLSAAPHEWLAEAWRVVARASHLLSAWAPLPAPVALLRRHDAVERVGVDGR
jgi:hypothetical protein